MFYFNSRLMQNLASVYFHPIATKPYGCPLLSTHSDAGDVDHDWLMVIDNLANYNLIGSFSLKEDSRVTLP